MGLSQITSSKEKPSPEESALLPPSSLEDRGPRAEGRGPRAEGRGPRAGSAIHLFSESKKGDDNRRIKTVEKAMVGKVMSTQF